MKKRMLSAMLALAMLCGSVPAPAFAQDLAGSDSAIVLTETTTDEETPASTEVTEAPEATATPEPTQAPEAAATPEPTQAPEAAATPEPTEAPEATATPEPTQAPEATATPVPTETPAPAEEPVPQTLGAVPSLLAANDGDVEPVTYLTWDDTQRASVPATCSEYTALSNESISTTWGAGWYVLDADKEFSARITLQGDVYLILMDGYTLTAIGGIGLSSGSSLTIYGQENDTGTLIATAAEGDAGIGGNGYKGADASGDITICGGTVVATGGTEGGAGIGSGRDDRTNIEITIYGGIVKATGGTDAAGIGSSPGGSIDYITLAGGTIEAAHGEVKRQDIESMYNGEEDAPYDVGPGWKGSMKARMSFVAGSGGFDDDKGEPVLQSGSSNGTTYSRYVVDISGGNLYTTGGGNALTTENPYNGNYGDLTDDSKAVYCAVADLGAMYANQSVSGTITVDEEEYLYNFNGVRADANGKLHLYLFAGEAALSVDGIEFKYTGTIDADNHTLQPTLGGTVYFNETTPYQDKLTVNTDNVTPASYQSSLIYTWYRCDDSTGANATLIDGANTSTYTLTDEDQGKYIKVEVSAAGFEGNPLSTVSHQVGSDTAANILRITGAMLDTKAYDGTGDWNVQNVTFGATTLTMGEDYTATASIVGTNYNAGGFKKVTVTVTLLNSAYTFEGDKTEATYTLTGQTVVPATLTVASATALNRKADGTTTVQITGVTLHGVVEGEDVRVDTTSLTGELSGSTAGSYDKVSITQALTLTGAGASNYTLTQPTEAVTLDPAVILKGAEVDQDSNGVYQIQTEDDLFWFAALVNGTLTDGTDQDLDASAVLCSDIVISSDRTWIPIGDYSANTRNKYAGTFDGAGHTIDGLKADGGSAQGFVGYMDGGTIKNCTFNGTVTSSGSAGGICGSNYGTIENCTFNGTVTGSGNGSAGGICGSNSNSGTIKNCTSYGKVTSSKGNTGGICGYNSSTVTGCTNNAAVEGYFYFGGICGFNTGTITNCINKGEVKLTASQGRYMGGICGYSTNTITNCISSGKINGTCAAGICAWNSTTGTVTNCYWLTSSIGGTGVYDNDGTQDKVESKTATEFASGEVCWLLNNSSSESPVWYQNVDSGTMDNYPVLDSSHGTVYYYSNKNTYSNDPYKSDTPQAITDATVSLSPESFTYNGQSQTPKVTVTLNGNTLIEGINYTVEYSSSTINAGTVTVTVQGKNSFTGTATSQPTYTINKATPTLVWRNTSQALPYTGNPAAITAPTVTLVNGETYSGTISYKYKEQSATEYADGLPTNGGTYTVVASIKEQSNYNAATSGDLTLTIEQATASGTVTAVADLTYNGSAQALVTAGDVTGGTMQYSTEQNGAYSTVIPTGTEAKTYTVWYKVVGDANHSDSAPASVNVTIAKLPVTLSWGTTSFTYDGSAKCPTATVSNKVNTADNVTVTVTGGQTNASDTAYTATATSLTGDAAGNYTLTGGSNTQQTFTIAKAKPAVTNVQVSSPETIYDTTELASITLSHADTDTPGTVALDANQTLSVGEKEYNWTFTPTDATNYTTDTGSITLAVVEDTVKSIAVTKAPDKTTYTYGESLDITGMVVTATCESGKTKDVTKEVTVTPETLTTSVTALTISYGGKTTTQAITVNPKAVNNPTITLSDYSFEFTGEAITPTVVSVKDGDTVIPAYEYTVEYADNTNVGTATVTIVDAAGGNYTVSGSTTFQITKVKATVTKAPTANTLTYTGEPQALVTGGEATGGTMQYSTEENGPYDTAIPTGTNVGSYSVWYKVVGDENHSGTQPMEVKVTISQASIAEAEVTLSPESFTYNGQSQTPTVTVKLNGNALTEGDYTVTYSGDSIDAGTYTVTVTGKGNYSGTATEKPTYTINPAPLTISGATLADKTYDGTTAATVTDVTVTEVQGSDSLTPGEDYTSTAVFDDAGAGTGKTATVTVTLKNGNYKLASDTYQLTGQTIAKAAAAVAKDPAAVADLTYNGQAQALVTAGTATGGTMVYSLEQNGEYAESIPTGTAAGDYTVWYKVAGDANHNDTAPASEQVTIAKKAAAVTVQLDPANRITAGDDLPTVGLTYSGLVDGESLAPTGISVDGMPADSNTAKEYALTVSETTREEILALEAAKNYTITFTGMTLTILEKEVVVLPTEDENRYRLEQSELTEVPAELKEKYSEVEDIQNAMFLVAVEKLPGVTAENTELHDVTLLFSEDDGKTWVKATKDNFPASGITVTLPYPEGTNAADYDFVVTHMATVAMNGLGVGEVETPAVTKSEKGLRFTVRSLSPVAVSWSKIETGGSTPAPSTPAPSTSTSSSPDDSIYYTCPKCGYHNWTATDEGYRCDHCGNLVMDKQLAGYPNVKGTYTPATGSKPSTVTGVPQTGDESNPVLWLGLLIVSGLALGGLAIAKRKKQQK